MRLIVFSERCSYIRAVLYNKQLFVIKVSLMCWHRCKISWRCEVHLAHGPCCCSRMFNCSVSGSAGAAPAQATGSYRLSSHAVLRWLHRHPVAAASASRLLLDVGHPLQQAWSRNSRELTLLASELPNLQSLRVSGHLHLTGAYDGLGEQAREMSLLACLLACLLVLQHFCQLCRKLAKYSYSQCRTRSSRQC
jgi:hypothetical protein